jgi:hypothetical protein
MQMVKAQGYIESSTYLGGTNFEADPTMVVFNGETYIFGQSTSGDFPRTLGSLYGGGAYDATLTKLDASGNVLWSRFIGGNGLDFPTDIMVNNGLVFVAINTTSTNFPVTNGSTKSGVASDNNSAFAVLNAATGTIQFSSYLAKGYPQDIAIEGNSVYISGTKDIGSPLQNLQLQLVKYDITTNGIIYNKDYGGSGSDGLGELTRNNKTLQVANGKVFLAGASSSTNFPVTNGSVITGTSDQVYLKINGTTGNIEFATYFGGSTLTLNNSPLDLRVDNNGVYILGLTDDLDFPVTDGSINKGLEDFYLRKYDINTNAVVFSKLMGSGTAEYIGTMEVENGTIYLTGELVANIGYPHTVVPAFYSGFYHLFYTKINANSGNINYSTWIHSNRNEYFGDFEVQNGDIYLTGALSGSAEAITYPITNGSSKSGGGDEIVVTKINADNQICYSTFLGGVSDDYVSGIHVENDSIYIIGNTSGNTYPVTNIITKKTGNDFIWTKLSLNPNLTVATDNVSPSTQAVCRNGLATLLTAPTITFPADSMPIIYRNAVPSNQTAIELKYQWQQSSSASGPWTDIPGAIQLNYTPQVGLVDVYYRRLANSSVCGSSTPISTSSVASVFVNANTAPSVTVGNVVNTCVGSTVLLGGSPTATANGGASIVSYLWTPSGTYTPNDAVANPTITTTGTTIYNVLVTDNNGCQQIGQQLVNAYAANAGGNKSACNGQAVRIGSAPIAGLPGVTYSWASSPADPTMSCTTCAQPDVNPTVATTYTLTLTVPITGGGTCSTTSTCVVTPVAAPVTPNFAGPDVVICAGSTATLGTVSESGFTYTWAPGNYLVTNNTAQVTFQPGSLSMPNPNPITYFVTASKSGCSFVDQTVASVIEARAAQDGCGPRMLGEGDRTPNINETYLWTKISGDGNIIGPNNLPQIQVGATTSGNTIYQLSVTYNGTTCTDQVVVPTCGCPVPNIAVEAPNSCASYSLNGGSVALTATSPINCTFTWSPAAGLSSTTGQTVYLTDNVSRTYTVTATSVVDPSFFCTNSRTVNNPAWSLPVFTAKDTIVCPGDAIAIGQALVAGYDYLWSGNISLLSSSNSSNPTAIVSSTNAFPVLVTDIGSGCTKRDIATVTILGLPANVAGSDVTLCGTGTVQLGQAPQPNITYIWTPATTYTPNNTSANPTVTVATTTSFTVVATNSITGCSVTDTVLVTVNPAVAPFSFTNQTFCPSTAGAMPLPAGPSGMAAYSWSPASIVLNNISNGPTATSLATRPQTAVNYILTITNAQGCTQAAQVTFTPSVSIPTTGGNKVLCTGASAQLGGPAESGATYTWSSNPTTGNPFFSSTSVSNPTFTPTTAGTYTLTVSKTDIGGCVTTATMTAVVNTISLPAISSPTVCQNTCVGIGTSLITPGAQYFWSPTTGLNNPNISNPIACVTNSTVTYKLTVVGANGCTDTRSVVVGVNPSPSPTITIPAVTACLGDAAPTINPVVTPSGTYNYQWLPDNGTLSNIYVSNPTVNLTGIGTKTYTLAVTNTTSGCANTATAVVNVNSCPISTCTIGVTCNPTPQSNCSPANGSATTTLSGGQGTITYLWSSGETTSSIGGKAAGTYTVTVTDNIAAGCTATCQAVITSNLNLPDAVCSKADNTNCTSPNGSASVTTNASNPSYLWSNNATTSTITGLSAGTYMVTVTDTATGCTSTCQAMVENPIVTPTFAAVSAICEGEILTALPTTSNNSITGTWSPALNNAATTNYTFTPAGGQCATPATLTITVNPNVTPTFTAVPPICEGEILSALPTTSNNGITGTWSPALNNAATTTYTFTPGGGQCATPATLTITVNPNVTPTFTAVPPICEGGILGALPTTSNNGITGTWSPALNNAATTTYTFTPGGGQCATPSTLAITVNPIPSLTFTTVRPQCIGLIPQNNGIIRLTSSSNVDKYGISTGTTYSGAPYATANTLPALPFDVQTMIPNSGGTYTLRLYNGANDCYKDTTIRVLGSLCATPCGTMTVTAVPTICTPSTNLYDVSGEVSFTSTPTTGTLTITNSGGGSVTLNAPFTSPMAYTIPNLVSTGMTHTVTAVFSEDPTFCTESVDYMAPASCNTLPCPPKVCLPITVTRN